MDEQSELDKTVAEIIKHVGLSGLDIFYARKQGNFYSSYFEWDICKGGGWKQFFDVAKRNDVSTVIAKIKTLSLDELEKVRAIDEVPSVNQKKCNNDSTGDKNFCCIPSAVGDMTSSPNKTGDSSDGKADQEPQIDYEELLKHVGHIGKYEFLWTADGRMYLISETASWYEPIAGCLSDDDFEFPTRKSDASRISTRLARRKNFWNNYGYGGIGSSNNKDRIPRALRENSKEDLVNDFVKYVRLQVGSDDGVSSRLPAYIADSFWREKGVDRRRRDIHGNLQSLIHQVEREGMSRLEALRLEREKARIPALLDEYFQWCKENEVHRITSSAATIFLREKRTSLSERNKRLFLIKMHKMAGSKKNNLATGASVG